MEYGFITGFLGYLVGLGLLGAWFYKNSKSTHDYTLGGRSLGYWTTALAAHASDMSIWMFMGLPAAAYTTGLNSLWIPLGLIFGMFITWKIIALPLRIATETYMSETLPTFFEKRFNDKTGTLRFLSAFFSLWFFTFYISSGLVGMGDLFRSALHIDYFYGVLLGLIITICYTLLGGFTGIAQSHFFQGMFLVSMMIIVPLFASFHLSSEFSFAQHTSLFNFIPSTFSALIGSLVLAISWGMGYFGQPHILVNFMSIKDPHTMPKAMKIGMLWQLFTQGSSVIIGLLGIVYFVTPLADQQLVFVSMVQTLFPTIIAGIILSSVVTAGLTTIATQMLVSAATITHDIYGKLINPHATHTVIRSMTRYVLIAIPCISFCLAFTKYSTVFNLVEYAWSGLGATFGPIIIAALYLPRSTTQGVIVALCASGCLAICWPLFSISILSIIPASFLGISIIALTQKSKS